MFKNYFKIAIRNLLKNKTFSVINILGLAFGLCCALLIALWVQDEYAINNYHSKKDRIYWVISEIIYTDESRFWNSTPGPLAEQLKSNITGIEHAVRFSDQYQMLFKKGETKIEQSGMAVDTAFLDVFDFPLQSGDVNTALSETYNIILSDALAKKLFPDSDPINSIITLDDWGTDVEYKVTGVLETITRKSTLKFDYLVTYESYLKKRPWNMQWNNYNDQTVVLLSDNADVNTITQESNAHFKEHTENKIHFYPFKDYYLKADLSNGIEAEGRIVYVRIFTIIAFVILLIACINFMNLSTARAGKRAKEVGVRKATGADREDLVFQFLNESILIAIISGILAITMADLLMVFFNQLTGKQLAIPYSEPVFIITFMLICLLTGIMAGIYPALYLSKFNPSQVLKSAVSSGKSLAGFRRVLVIAQFSLSITFVVTTIIAYNQLQFILTKDVGLNKENILYHHMNSILGSGNANAYRNELLKIPEVKEVARANFTPLQINNTTNSVSWQGKPDEAEISFHVIVSDQHLPNAFNMEILEGRQFSDTYDTALIEVMVNEEALNTMLISNPIGSRIQVWGNEAEIVGVVKDFHHQSLDQGIEPIVIFKKPSGSWRNFVVIEGDITSTISKIENVYSQFEKNYPFDYGFVDQDFEAKYKSVSIMGKLSNVFALVAIFVSCLGLFGLASYMTEQRKKETGIRKVMGASVFGLVTMFTRNFLWLILLSFIISAPVAWYLATQWLSNFAFRIEMGVTPFIIGGASAALIAIATVSYHTVKSAVANPIDSLKYE